MILEAQHVIEECSELIQAICKLERFGKDNYHPDRLGTSNFIEMQDEFEDVLRAYRFYLTKLNPE
jgi:NTP pyrophosphatase (non-canonical NTP hydrolase)